MSAREQMVVPRAGSEAGPALEVSAGPACSAGPENTEARCSDGVSNDGDSYIDCNDYDCCGAGLSVCDCCGPGCLPRFEDECTCSPGCISARDCATGEYCWGALDCLAECRSVPPPSEARVVSVLEFNLHGGGGRDVSPAFIDTLVQADADLAVLIEADWEEPYAAGESFCALYFSQINRALAAAGRSPYTDFHCARGIPYPTLGSVLLSRFAILEVTYVGEGHAASGYADDDGQKKSCDAATTDPFMHYLVDTPGAGPTHVVSGHLKCCAGAENEARRMLSQTCLDNYLRRIPPREPLIYLGDFNSFSPQDVAPCVTQRGLGDGPLRAALLEGSSGHRLVDAFRVAVPLRCEAPESLGITYPAMNSRIDFVLVNDPLSGAIDEARLIDAPSSDHRALRVSLAYDRVR